MSSPPPPTARQRYGGMKPGAAFLGLASAYGIVVMVTSLASAVALIAEVRVAPPSGLQDLFLTRSLDTSPEAALSYVAGLAAVLVAYYLGGYVAGRMARFDGARQGLAVWLWSLVVAAVTIVLSFALAGSGDSLVGALTRVPLAGWLAVGVALVVQLVGAVLGGLAGMRFHRRVDRAEALPGDGPVASAP